MDYEMDEREVLNRQERENQGVSREILEATRKAQHANHNQVATLDETD